MNKKIVDILEYVIIIALVIIIRTFVVTPALVNGASMEPSLYNNEVLILNKLKSNIKDFNRFDIIVFKYNGENLIKRVIAFPGEKIEYKNNKLYINDEEIITKENFEKTEDFSFEVPENSVFVLGDNRDDSKDSRYFGSVNEENIIGKISFRLFPVSKFGSIKFE
jgi:signal peptidase I